MAVRFSPRRPVLTHARRIRRHGPRLVVDCDIHCRTTARLAEQITVQHFSISRRHDARLIGVDDVIAGNFGRFLERRNPAPESLIHHSDRGVQYASNAYVERLKIRGVDISMSRPANPYDLAKAESFMKTLKTEEVNAAIYRDRDDAEQRIGAFIETVYNANRLHSALGYKPPEQFEAELSSTDRRPVNLEASSLN